MCCITSYPQFVQLPFLPHDLRLSLCQLSLERPDLSLESRGLGRLVLVVCLKLCKHSPQSGGTVLLDCRPHIEPGGVALGAPSGAVW